MTYNSLFSKTPATFVDQYADSMADADIKAGELTRISTSQVFFRDLVNNGFKDSSGNNLKVPYLLVAGLGPFFEWFDNWKFTQDDEDFFASLKDPEGGRVFSDLLIDHLKNMKWRVDIDAMPEGEIAFPDEPIVRITGPHYQVQMLEAALLNLITSHTGWATIASQFRLAAEHHWGGRATLMEFGARRTPEWGGLGSARSAYLAGWDGTSNLYAGQVYGIPTAGTMAHAFIMVQQDELTAFRKWAKNKPHLGVFLVDTYDTEQGIRNALQVCQEEGIKLRGIRLDSGDVDYLSRLARQMLDEAGFKDAMVMASDSLSVEAVHKLYQVNQAPLQSFGIGGNYVTRRQDNGGSTTAVMKAAATDGRDLMKFSDSADKSTIPGVHDVIRYLAPGKNGGKFFAGDTILPIGLDVGDGHLNREIISVPRRGRGEAKPFPAGAEFYRPIEPFVRNGQHLFAALREQNAKAVLQAARDRAQKSMHMLEPSHKEIMSPRLYIAGVESELFDRQARAVRDNRMRINRPRQAKRFAAA